MPVMNILFLEIESKVKADFSLGLVTNPGHPSSISLDVDSAVYIVVLTSL